MEVEAPTVQLRRDPFAPNANPAAYVPRTATEAVITRLETALRDGATALSLCGPAGAGKTLLLHVLADRLDGDFHATYMPYPKLSAAEFCQWALAALMNPARLHVAASQLLGFRSRSGDTGWNAKATYELQT